MSTKIETEEISTSGAEKLLAVVLAAFILIGAIWAYDQIGDFSSSKGFGSSYGGRASKLLSPVDRTALKTLREARIDRRSAAVQVRRKRGRTEFAREAYRTELEAGRPAGRELAAYRAGQADLAKAQRQQSLAQRRVEAATPAAAEADNHLSDARAELKTKTRNEDRWVFILRLILVAAMLGGGYWSLSRVRKTRSRLLPLALAEIGAAAALAVYMAGDYGSEYFIFEDTGPLLISIVGVVLTVVAFILLQRYLARRIPLRRVRKGECPFCGYPGRDASHCEGCGRRIVGECTTCHEARRVATPHCGSCGST